MDTRESEIISEDDIGTMPPEVVAPIEQAPPPAPPPELVSPLEQAARAMYTALEAGDHHAALAAAHASSEHAVAAGLDRHQLHSELLARNIICHPQGKVGETIDELIARAKKPSAADGPLVHGELKVITCQSPLHETRRGYDDEHDYRDHLGVYDGTHPPGMMCNRCAHHDGIEERKAKVDRREALKAAFRVDDAALDLLLAVAKEPA